MLALVDIIRFITVSHLVVLIFLVCKAPIKKQELGIMVYMAACTIGFLLADWDPLQEYPWIFLPILVLPMTLPFAFWQFSKVLFDDDYFWRPWYLWLILGILVIHYACLFGKQLAWFTEDSAVWTLSILIPQVVSIFFVFLAIIEAVRNRSSDLILSRMHFRTIFVFVTALAIVLTILFEIGLSNQRPSLGLELWQKLSIAALIFYFSLQRLAFKPGFFKEASKNPANSALEVDELLVNQLLHQVEHQKIYQQSGLTIRQFAQILEVKEYKLRQTINRHLGFKNFNEFLNSYRVQEARDILSNPDQKDLTILEIAYDMGYQSLAPFNKAFKATTGMTPTSYRKKNLG